MPANGYSKTPLFLLLPDIRYPGLNPGPSGCVLLLLLLLLVFANRGPR